MQQLGASLFIIPTIIATCLGFRPQGGEVVSVQTIETPAESAEPSSTVPAEPALDLNNINDLKKFAEGKIQENFGDGQWEAFDQLITTESGWNVNAKNPHSTAFGLGQFLISTQRNYGIEGCTDPEKQLLATIEYIKDRYDNPCGAWSHHLKKGWY